MKKNFNFYRIGERYDPENDCRSQDLPPVTWAEKALYDAVKALALRVNKLETQSDYPMKKKEYCQIARDLSLDNAIRTVAKSGKNHDSGPNWYAKFENFSISATFGAGTNSASVTIDGLLGDQNLPTPLYRASDYGRSIEIFRYGPWVHRLIAHAEEIRAVNETQRQANEVAEAEIEAAKFADVDF